MWPFCQPEDAAALHENLKFSMFAMWKANNVRILKSERLPYIYMLEPSVTNSTLIYQLFPPLSNLKKNGDFTHFDISKWQSKHPGAPQTSKRVESKGNVILKPSHFHLLSISLSSRQTPSTGCVRSLGSELWTWHDVLCKFMKLFVGWICLSTN
jgi:hypothetical protein